ncbi:MAG TPA: Hsp20/alpha crystallin family protein [Polyangiaceae bacterium]
MTDTNLQRRDETLDNERAWCVYSPDVDIYENDDAFLLVADLPGVAADRIGLDLKEGVLTLSAELGNVGRYQSSYRRQWKLPVPVDSDQISAESKLGELTVRIPKAAVARKRQIPVRAN